MQEMSKGSGLEARMQRLFMCQGALAERGLFMRAERGGARLVTDVDVLAHDYRVNLHHTKIYAECKGGRRVRTLDRLIWVRGVMDVLGAAQGYLVVRGFDPSSAVYARKCNVNLLEIDTVGSLETALGVSGGFWPGRSNRSAYESIEKEARELAGSSVGSGAAKWADEALRHSREFMSDEELYGRLNAIVRLLLAISRLDIDGADRSTIRFLVSALMVRLCQCTLAVTAETMTLNSMERESYLVDRFLFGGSDPGQARKLIEGALKLARAHMREQGCEPNIDLDSGLMLRKPAYVGGFSEMVTRLIAECGLARQLPLCLELELFGVEGGAPGGFLEALAPSRRLVGLIRAFMIQSLGVPSDYCAGMVDLLDGLRNPFEAPGPGVDVESRG